MSASTPSATPPAKLSRKARRRKKQAGRTVACTPPKDQPKTGRSATSRAATTRTAKGSAAKGSAANGKTAKAGTANSKAASGRTTTAKAAKAKPCTTPKPPVTRRPKLTPKLTPTFIAANPAVSARAPLPAPAPANAPAPGAAAGDRSTTAPAPPAAAAGGPAPDFGPAQAERLLWRAGFGPGPGDVDRLVSLGLDGAVASLVHPSGEARLVGPEPHDADGNALAPADLWGHDHCWWLDRMVRSDQPLVERMTLVWHDWFATSDDKVGKAQLMLDQNATLRAGALGSFADLLTAVTRDPAMLVFLDGVDNAEGSPNENHARELMELFTLGADRGAYTESDVRELARVMTGWRVDWVDPTGWANFRFDDRRHDPTSKTVFGQTGAFGYDDAARLVLANADHASFFVAKLWDAFIPDAPDAATQARLEELYVGGGHQIAPVVEAILKHPALYTGGAMAKSPVVYTAGLLRALGRGIDTTDWAWLCLQAGQLLFRPPNVAGWDDTRWLDTSTWRARWNLSVWATKETAIDPWRGTPYDAAETAPTSVERASSYLGRPSMTPEQSSAVLDFATRAVPPGLAAWQQSPYRAMRQNALRLLISTAADYQVS